MGFGKIALGVFGLCAVVAVAAAVRAATGEAARTAPKAVVHEVPPGAATNGLAAD